MTTITVYPGNPYRLRFDGHAGAAPRGQDIVCAGVSALAMTLIAGARKVPEYRARIRMVKDPAEIEVVCDPENECRYCCQYLYQIVLDGLRLIADQYGEYVKIIEGEERDDD